MSDGKKNGMFYLKTQTNQYVYHNGEELVLDDFLKSMWYFENETGKLFVEKLSDEFMVLMLSNISDIIVNDNQPFVIIMMPEYKINNLSSFYVELGSLRGKNVLWKIPGCSDNALIVELPELKPLLK